MTQQIIISSATIIGLAILAIAALKGWQGWLALKERELDRTGFAHGIPAEPETITAGGIARIEIADLKERIRKLEAIASGVDL